MARASGSIKKSRRYTILFMVMVLLCPVLFLRPATAQEVQEYQIKAVFLYNLTHFVYWSQADSGDKRPFTVGVYGKDPFGEILDRAIAGEKKFGSPIKIHRFTAQEHIDINCCHILFIGKDSLQDWEELKRKLGNKPVLTVSDGEGFTSSGGMVSLLKKGKKIQVQINLTQVKQAGLGMSAKLLRLAEIVE